MYFRMKLSAAEVGSTVNQECDLNFFLMQLIQRIADLSLVIHETHYYG